MARRRRRNRSRRRNTRQPMGRGGRPIRQFHSGSAIGHFQQWGYGAPDYDISSVIHGIDHILADPPYNMTTGSFSPGTGGGRRHPRQPGLGTAPPTGGYGTHGDYWLMDCNGQPTDSGVPCDWEDSAGIVAGRRGCTLIETSCRQMARHGGRIKNLSNGGNNMRSQRKLRPHVGTMVSQALSDCPSLGDYPDNVWFGINQCPQTPSVISLKKHMQEDPRPNGWAEVCCFLSSFVPHASAKCCDKVPDPPPPSKRHGGHLSRSRTLAKRPPGGRRNWTEETFMSEYWRNPQWQATSRENGWDSGGGHTVDSLYCLACCIFSSCCEGCSCGCDEPTDDEVGSVYRRGGRTSGRRNNRYQRGGENSNDLDAKIKYGQKIDNKGRKI